MNKYKKWYFEKSAEADRREHAAEVRRCWRGDEACIRSEYEPHEGIHRDNDLRLLREQRSPAVREAMERWEK